MSYNKSYRANVSYSGSVSYSYPASQNGGSGTAHYSGAIPVNVIINVDTDPFDASVNHFNRSVDVLGGSVAAMHTAQCAEIQQSAEKISGSLINGFFGTIKTEISQQLQALDSAIKAVFGLIQAQGKAITEKNTNMETDYNRISSRYMRLFSDLDSECYKRIYALDKQSFSLSEKVQKQLLSESSSNTAALNLLGIEEVSSSKTFIFVSSLNRKASDVINTLHSYINQESKTSALINSFLSGGETGEKISLAVPVIWSQSDMLDGAAVINECFIPGYIDQQGKERITEKVNAFCAGLSPDLWESVENGEKELINGEFNILAESCFVNTEDETERRIYRTMMSLWQNAELFSPPSMERSL